MWNDDGFITDEDLKELQKMNEELLKQRGELLRHSVDNKKIEEKSMGVVNKALGEVVAAANALSESDSDDEDWDKLIEEQEAQLKASKEALKKFSKNNAKKTKRSSKRRARKVMKHLQE